MRESNSFLVAVEQAAFFLMKIPIEKAIKMVDR